MKRLLFVALAAIGIFLLGCTGSQQNAATGTEGTGNQAAPAPNPEIVPDEPPPAPPAELSDEDICNKMSAGDWRNWCLGSVTQDPSYCDKIVAPATIDGGRKSDCYFIIGAKKKNTELCGKIVHPGDKFGCLAVAENDITQCDNAGDYRSGCITHFAAFSKDPSLCANSGNTGYCYTEAARFTKDESVCRMDPYVSLDSCYQAVVMGSFDAGTCEKINNSDSRQMCIAYARKDYSLCNSVGNGLEETCRLFVALASRDWEYCKTNSNPDQCYFYVAIKGSARFMP